MKLRSSFLLARFLRICRAQRAISRLLGIASLALFAALLVAVLYYLRT